MTKNITKIIAGLGIVAGLGVAALPLGTYAANPQDVIVRVTITETVGTVEPKCTTAATSGAAGITLPDADCGIEGVSNTGIRITIKDFDTDLNLVGQSGAAATGPQTIAPIGATSNLADVTLATAPTGGWGYSFDTNSAPGLTKNPAHTGWNGITAADVMLASSTVPVDLDTTPATLSFRTATIASQAPGVYEDVVTITVSVNP